MARPDIQCFETFLDWLGEQDIENPIDLRVNQIYQPAEPRNEEENPENLEDEQNLENQGDGDEQDGTVDEGIEADSESSIGYASKYYMRAVEVERELFCTTACYAMIQTRQNNRWGLCTECYLHYVDRCHNETGHTWKDVHKTSTFPNRLLLACISCRRMLTQTRPISVCMRCSTEL